jgi:hypothetical protein
MSSWHRTNNEGKGVSKWRSSLSLDEVILRHLRGEKDMTEHLPLADGIPDPKDFVTRLRTISDELVLTADGAVPYGSYTAFYWWAFGCLYAYIPEVDSAERYEGKWAKLTSVDEFVKEVQHRIWHQEWVHGMDEYATQNPEKFI